MTRRINQKIAHKRKIDEQQKVEKDAKKSKKLETSNEPSCLVVEQLVGDTETALKALSTLAQCGSGGADEDPPDEVDEFFAGGGNANHILHVLDTNQEKNKANDVAAVFNGIEGIISRVVRCRDKLGDRSYDVANELVKRVVQDYGKELVLFLSGTNSAYQAKSVLRMLTAMVTLGPTQARELLMKINWEHDNWDTLCKRSSKKDIPDVRTCFLHFLLSFLIEPNSLVLKEYFSVKTRLSSLFPGLMHDKAETVLLLLETLKSKVLENPLVNKTQKMKVFGSHNIKSFLSLLSWSGPKSKEGEVEEGYEEQKEAVQEATVSFLNVLLGSTKLGVVFADTNVGQGTKNLNPLAKEVLLTMSKPWESVHLSSIIVDLVSACPDQLPTALSVLQDNAEPRDSPSWHMVMDLFLSIFEQQDCKSIAQGLKGDISIGKVVDNVVMPTLLLEKVITVGIEIDGPVSLKCIELLSLFVSNAEILFMHTSSFSKASVKEGFCGNVGKLNLNSLWGRIKGLLIDENNADYAIKIFHIFDFVVKYLGTAFVWDISEALNDIEINKVLLGAKHKALHLAALMLFNDVASSEHCLFDDVTLQKFCTENTFLLLAENIGTHDDVKKLSSIKILSKLIMSSSVCLKSGWDLDLLLDLIDKENFKEVSSLLLNTMAKKEIYFEKVDDLKFQEFCLRRKTGLKLEDLFESLMSPEFSFQTVESFILPEDSEEHFSPLIISILESHKKSDLLEKYLRRLIFIFEDAKNFCSQLEPLISKDTVTIKRIMAKENYQKTPFNGRPLAASTSLGFLFSILNEMLQSSVFNPQGLIDLVTNLPSEKRNKILDISIKSVINRECFNPFLEDKVDHCLKVITLLKLAGDIKITVDELCLQFLTATDEHLSDISKDQGPLCRDQSLILDFFSLVQFKASQLVHLVNSLVSMPVNKFCLDKNSSLISILAGLFKGLSFLAEEELNQTCMAGALSKLFCLVEVLLDSKSDLLQLTISLSDLITKRHSVSLHISTNLLVVLVKSNKIHYLSLANVLVKEDKRHHDAFKTWACQEKKSVTVAMWPLIRTTLESQKFENEKKFITIVLKRALSHVESIFDGSSECDENIVEMVSLLAEFSKSEKQVELWSKAVGGKQESADDCMKFSDQAVLLKFKILMTIQKLSGSCDSRLMKECFVPGLHHIGKNLKEGKDVSLLCSVATEIKETIENKMFAKEFGKSTEIWQKFYRNVLKYSLKAGDTGVPALNLLAHICEFLLKGSKLMDADIIVEMITSHSLYLGIVLGKHSQVKTSVINLMLSLSPHSCSLEQVPIILSGYTGTLNPSDRAILAFLHSHEQNGHDLAQFQPFVFGNSAVQHYSVLSTGAWKQPKVSEVLGLLDRDMMRKSCTKFPLALSLDPLAELETDHCMEIYDPRFILPLLSQLLAEDSYVDKHMALMESGALGYAISSLSSGDWSIRAAGYHVLTRIFKSLESAKLAQEKQIWLHIILLIKNALGTGTNITKGGKLSSMLTVFLVRVIDVLLNPLSPLYKTISKGILAKPALDLQFIPEFSRLLNSYELNSTIEQRWILEVIRDGMRHNLDYSLSVRTFLSKILMSQWECAAVDRVRHLQILDILERCVNTSYGCSDLITRQGLLSWLRGVVKHHKVEKLVVKKVMDILKFAVKTVQNMEKNHQDENKKSLMTIMETETFILLERVMSYSTAKNLDEIVTDVHYIKSCFNC